MTLKLYFSKFYKVDIPISQKAHFFTLINLNTLKIEQ